MLLMPAEPGILLDRAVTFRRSVAGAEANVAIELARLGHRTRRLGRVGADPVGETVPRQSRADGVDTSRVQVDENAPTSLLDGLPTAAARDSAPADFAGCRGSVHR
ncbi:hypothetical protein Sfr7A_31370 [Streptomyces xinghaiensis]|uniref:Carbohydrate kinase PfkB domain-containing protein n=1 Tax=Streptomyces xinghaiensis TaxID=1038928 RepID=A0A3R7LIG4_9ACTN|nr:hypothetical protein Sfr7A_31370 [Streptomyces xinghaiensis]RKM90242.1 hypothetical protein SFRA_031770 [Streptomyces xinghaiensis]RNC69146.1 hypothetical protein DC095_030410 [Streptomyces xinghaiensis]